MSNKSTATPHDTFFKHVMSDPKNIRDFIRGFLPEAISGNVDLDSIDYKDREKNTKRKRKLHLDLALTCKLNNQDAEIYLVFEHKSAPEKITLVQILTYCAAVWEHNILTEKRPPVPIIPIVFYHGKEPFKLPEQFGDYFNVPEPLKDYMVNFNYALFDTNAFDEESIVRKSYDNLFLAASLLSLWGIFRDLSALKPAMQNILKLESGERILIIEYILDGKEDDPDTFIEMMNELGGDDMPSIAEQLERRGEARGEARGVILGRRLERQRSIFQTIRNLRKCNTPVGTIAVAVDMPAEKVKQVIEAGDAGIDLIEIDESELKG